MRTISPKGGLNSFVIEMSEKALGLPPGPEREALLNKARRLADTTSHLDEWINSSGLQPPK